jgi:hypothetical protein
MDCVKLGDVANAVRCELIWNDAECHSVKALSCLHITIEIHKGFGVHLSFHYAGCEINRGDMKLCLKLIKLESRSSTLP